MEEKLVTLVTVTYTRAQSLKSRLESEGIDCFLQNINLIQGGEGGVKVRIRKSEMEQALRIVMEINKNYQVEKVENELKSEVRKILVPVNFSEHSKNASKFALSIAHKLNAEVFLFHSYFSYASEVISVTDTHASYSNLDMVVKEIEDSAKIDIEAMYTELEDILVRNNIDNVALNYGLSLGEPEEEILRFIRNYKPDFIVASEPRTADDKLSNVINNLVNEIRTPVLIIPEYYQFENIHSIDLPKKLVYTTNFDESDYLALRKLIAIVKPLNIDIDLIHICNDEEIEKCDKVKLDHFVQYFLEVSTDIDVSTTLMKEKDVLNSILNYIKEYEIDFLAITTHKRDILEKFVTPSITLKLLNKLEIPVLVFHA
jgi:nucleotide-binding universal stress UspA family protein